MLAVSDYADVKFNQIMNNIIHSPKSWENWVCLHVFASEIKEFTPGEKQYIKEAIDSYIDGLDEEGFLFLCEHGDVLLMSDSMETEMLQKVEYDICQLIRCVRDLQLSAWRYDLPNDVLSLFDHINQDSGFYQKVIDQLIDLNDDIRDISTVISELMDADILEDLPFLEEVKNVMIVEDDLLSLQMASNALKNSCKLIEAENVKQALHYFAYYNPEIIFLDINLPDGNGLDLLKHIKQNNPECHVVMISSHNSNENILRAIDDGASDFIAKPFVKSALVEQLEKYHVAV